jgi:hypothetical protein
VSDQRADGGRHYLWLDTMPAKNSTRSGDPAAEPSPILRLSYVFEVVSTGGFCPGGDDMTGHWSIMFRAGLRRKV